MTVYPKVDIKNLFGIIIWYKNKAYEAKKLFMEHDSIYYIVTCELIGNEYPTMSIQEIEEKFNTTEDNRDSKIKNILK